MLGEPLRFADEGGIQSQASQPPEEKVIDQLVGIVMQAGIAWVAIKLIAFIIGCWIAYEILKAAIRDGINEARPNWAQPQIDPVIRKEPGVPVAPQGYRWELVKERSEVGNKRQG